MQLTLLISTFIFAIVLLFMIIKEASKGENKNEGEIFVISVFFIIALIGFVLQCYTYFPAFEEAVLKFLKS